MQHIITLLTDFGIHDTYVGQLKASILGVCRECHLVDLSHQVRPQDVQQAGLMLRDAAFVFPAGTIHVVVVDPGVGTDRSIVAARIQEHTFVLPDNGLLTYVLQDKDCELAVVVDKPTFWRPTVSATFHGRDIMGPVAGHLAAGRRLEELGTATDELTKLERNGSFVGNASGHAGDAIAVARVLLVDYFGNCILEFADAEPFAERLVVRVGERAARVQAVITYGQADAGALVLLKGSAQRWELAVVNGSAAQALGVQPGQTLSFHL